MAILDLKINEKEALWWNFNHKNDIRKYYPDFNEFMNQFTEVGEIENRKLYVSFNEEIPMTNLPLEIGNQRINLFVTARPFTEKEILQYTSERTYFQALKGKYFDEEGNVLEKNLLVNELKKQISSGSQVVADQFFPHIRGVIKEVKKDFIFYHKPYFENYPQIQENLIENKKDFLDFECTSYMSHNFWEQIENCADFCSENDLLYHVKNSINYRIHKPIKFPKSFSFEFYDKLNLEKNPQYTYYPVTIEGLSQSIPFAITNKFYREKGLFNPGLFAYGGFYPIKSEEVLRESSRRLSDIFGEEIKPVYFERRKGSLFPVILK